MLSHFSRARWWVFGHLCITMPKVLEQVCSSESSWNLFLLEAKFRVNHVSGLFSNACVGSSLECLYWVPCSTLRQMGGKKGFRATVHCWALDKHLSGASDKEDSRPYLNGKEKATASARWHSMTQWESQKYPSWGMRMLFSRWCCDIHHAANPMIQVSTVKSQWWIETATI